MNAIAPQAETATLVEISDLLDSPYQKPRVSKRGNLDELAASIKEVGVLEPLIARRIGSGAGRAPAGPSLELVAGHRRKLAAAIAKINFVPVLIREYTDDQVLEIQTIENSQREDVHPLDEADNFAALVKRGRAPAQIAEKIGRDTRYVVQRMQLCELSPECRKAFDEERITLGVALMIARIPDRKLQLEALEDLGGDDQRDGVTAKHAGEIIRKRFMLRLVDAPFDRGAAALVPKAGACTVCPKRSGNHLELFSDVDSPDVCTDPVCYRSKLDAHWVLLQAEAKKGGGRVLADTEAKKVFSQHGGDRTQHGSAWANLESEEWDGTKHVKVTSLLKGQEAAVTLARNAHTGSIVELVPRKLVDAAIKSAQAKRSKVSGSSSAKKPSANDKAQAERDAFKAKVKNRADELMVAAVAGKVEKLGPKADRIAFDLVLGLLASLGLEGLEYALQRVGTAPKNSSMIETEKAAVKWAGNASEAELRALVVEVIVADAMDLADGAADRVCKRLGLDRAAFTKQATEAIKKMGTPAASLPAAKPKPAKASPKKKSKR